MSRTVIVGDIHGCRAELSELLSKIGFSESDRLVSVGDVLARGPDSHGVLRLLLQLGARIVRGNHEEKLLRHRDALRSGLVPEPMSAMHQRLADSLEEPAWEALEQTPLHLDLAEHGVRVVHAGVLARLPIEHHARRTLFTMRTLTEGGAPSEKAQGELWGLKYRGPLHVVFGHHAQRATQLHPFATGIDTACVYGGALTAVVLREGERMPSVRDRRAVLVSVPARRVWYRGASR